MKKPGAKQNQKELEAQRLIEEQRHLEEEQRKQEEEKKKFRVITLPDTGLPLFLTKFCVEEVWENERPIEFMDDYLKIIFENEQIELGETERKVVAEQLVYDLVFIKDGIKLNGDNAVVL